MAESKPLIVIPARIGSTRLKDKPLRLIGGVPLIEHVWRRAIEADIGPVWVSTDSVYVQAAIQDAGGEALYHLPVEHCGTDRVAAATKLIRGEYGVAADYVINLQGDLPFIDPAVIRALWLHREISKADIVTAIHECHWVAGPKVWERCSEYVHIGVYAFTVRSLRRFASLEPTEAEREEKLEQLRALDNGMTFDFIEVDHMPLEINTESDLKHANLIASMLGRTEDTGARA